MGKNTNKIFADLCGKPVLSHTLKAFQLTESIDEIIVVTGEQYREEVSAYGFAKVTAVVPGGNTREESVLNALNTLDSNSQEDVFVAIHDGARPLITLALIDKVVETAKLHGAAIAAVPAKDTMKVCEGDSVKTTPDRRTLFCAQTPQVFDLKLYRKALDKYDGSSVSDDSSLFERAGIPVKIVEGDYRNIKITTPEDLKIAKAFLI